MGAVHPPVWYKDAKKKVDANEKAYWQYIKQWPHAFRVGTWVFFQDCKLLKQDASSPEDALEGSTDSGYLVQHGVPPKILHFYK